MDPDGSAEGLFQIAGDDFGIVGRQRQVQQLFEEARRLRVHTRPRAVFSLEFRPFAISRRDS